MFRFNLQRTGTPLRQRGCPLIALAGEESNKIATFRKFRDQVLANNIVGKKVIRVYYENGKTITEMLERSTILAQTAKMVLNALTPLVGLMVE